MSHDRTVALREPTSGKESELAYMPESVSRKLAEYTRDKALQSDNRPFPICYSTAIGKVEISYFLDNGLTKS